MNNHEVSLLTLAPRECLDGDVKQVEIEIQVINPLTQLQQVQVQIQQPVELQASQLQQLQPQIQQIQQQQQQQQSQIQQINQLDHKQYHVAQDQKPVIQSLQQNQIQQISQVDQNQYQKSQDQKPLIQQSSNIDDKKSAADKKKKEAIDGQAREIIFKVIKFFESEKQNRGYAYPVENVVKRACAATGLSESTIKRIKRDGLRAEATQTRMTGPKKKRVRKTKVQLDYFQLCALRTIVNNYTMRKEVPTLGKILEAAKTDLNYCGGKESLRLILLNKLGIKFKKCEKKTKPKMETVAPAPPPQQMSHIIQHPPMQQVKPMDTNQYIYAPVNMMQSVPPVSY